MRRVREEIERQQEDDYRNKEVDKGIACNYFVHDTGNLNSRLWLSVCLLVCVNEKQNRKKLWKVLINFVLTWQCDCESLSCIILCIVIALKNL